MVFESVLTQVLNRVLGAYVENLDTNQLRVGIWGGDVELNNLVLKQSALEDLDLPIQTIYGKIGKLVLKIPWKNLYGAAFVIDVEDIYLLAAPNQQVQYNEEKEKLNAHEAKKKEILKVELAKKQEAEKDKPKADSTFVEKLITQIIKNVQLNVKNIHIRYEDKVTNANPFALGITLSNLDVVSTDENWQPAITTEEVRMIYKVVQMDGLAVYWNSNTKCYDDLPRVDLVHKLSTEIASHNVNPLNYTYILGPINASARLRINQRPDLDSPPFHTPKIHLNLEMERLFIGVTKAQYRDIIALADSMDRMIKGIPYRKYRPPVPSYKGYYKEWWHFAYISVLEGEVRRRRRNWEWNHIHGHRCMLREYAQLYEKKLQNKATQSELQQIESCESMLDTFNIVVIRQRVEFETEKLLAKQKEEKGWFSWVWGGKSSSNVQGPAGSGLEIRQQFEEAMTKEEKNRLYKAIGYQENALPSEFPEAYVDNSCTFCLKTLEMELSDELIEEGIAEKVQRVVFTELKEVWCRVETRSAANSLKVNVKIDEFTTFGLQQNDFLPQMITSDNENGDSGLFEVTFETNPLDGNCGQRLHVTSQPLKIVYDAETIIKVVDIFKVPSESTAIDQLSAAAEDSLSNIKDMSASGLQHAIDSHIHLDLKVDFRAPYIIIPYGGQYTENENVLVLNLGNFKMRSLDRPVYKEVRKMYAEGYSEEKIREQLTAQSYDRFKLELTHLQILLAQTSEDWRSKMKEAISSNMHVVEPINLNVSLDKCMITDDPKFPLMKISGELASISVNVSDARLLLAMALAKSIPFPGSDAPEPVPLDQAPKRESSLMIKYWEMQQKANKTKDLLPKNVERKTEQFLQFTTVAISFVMKEMSLSINHQDTVESPITRIASFSTKNLTFGLIQQTYNTKITVNLDGITLIQTLKSEEINMIKSYGFESGEQCLIRIEFAQVNKSSPEFHSTYKSCESNLVLEFAKIGFLLHKEGLLELIHFVKTLQTDIDEIYDSKDTERVGSATPRFTRRLSAISEGLSVGGGDKKTRRTPVVVETIKFKLLASLEELTMELQTSQQRIANLALKGIKTSILVKSSYTQINANLNQVVVIDLNPVTVHPLILTVQGNEALSSRIVLYNNDENTETDKSDISVDLTMGGLRIMFLNLFVSKILDFLSEFQTAQTAIVEASQAAAQSAKENMQNVYEKATKLSLCIDLKAPDIIIPENSESHDAIFLDLGRIAITNRFSTLDFKNEKGGSPVIDEIKLKLSDMKLARVRLDSKDHVVNELPLLTPLTFKVDIKRNLTSSWYKAVPDLDIAGRIFQISLELSQIDYQTIMGIIDGNLGEGKSQVQAPEKVAKVTKPVEQVEQKPVVEVKSSANTTLTAGTYEDQLGKTNCFMRLNFTMDNVILALFTGGSKALSAETARTQRSGLARFSLEGISLKVRMLSDNSILLSFLLLNCLLDDCRKGREDQLNRLLQRTRAIEASPTASSSSLIDLATKSMVDIVFQMKDNDMFVDMKVFSFSLILSVDYMMKLVDFLSPPKAEGELAAFAPKAPQIKSTQTAASVASIAQKEAQLTVNLRVEKPDIVLVEHMDSPDTQALILNSEILVKLRTAGAHQVINGYIKDLQLYTCNYDQRHSLDTISYVLHPVTVNLAGSTPEDKGLHIELIVTDMRLSVSPAVIELLSRVSATATGGGKAVSTEETELQDHSNAWDARPFKEQQFWFFKTDEGLEATEALTSVASPKKPSQEKCIISMKSIIVTMEAGVGSKTLPMLIIESGLKGTVCNWSSQMSAEAYLTLQMNYYNSTLALWEPLIEPVEVVQYHKSKWVPWELKVEVSMNEREEVTTPSTSEGGSFDVLQQPQQALMSVDVTSDHNMEVVITKTCLEVLNNLGKAFATAMKPTDKVGMLEHLASYKVVNELGCSILVNLEGGSFALFQNEGTTEVILENGAEVQLQKKVLKSFAVSMEKIGTLVSGDALDVNKYFITIKVVDKCCYIDVPVVRADQRYFPLNYRGENNDTWGLISDVKVEDGVTVITIRSILQVHNHFNIPMEVYYMTASGNELEFIMTVEPDSHVNIPLNAVYTATNELFFAVAGYSVTSIPYIWKDLQANLSVTKMLQCKPKSLEYGTEPFIIQAVGVMHQVYFESTCKHTMASTCYNIHLRPSVIFKNCLPVDIVVCVENMVSEISVEPGKNLLLPNVEPGRSAIVVRLPTYLEKEWSCRHELVKDPSEFSAWNFNSYDSVAPMTLALGMHVTNEKGSVEMTLYCPFWMLNKTGLTLSYRNADENANVLHHPSNFKGPIMFSFNAKNFFGKKKAAVRVAQGEWSDKFSLDVAGSSGVVVCKADNILYQLGVQNQLTYNGLTKQVTFTPYYVIINNAPFAIECQENDRPGDPWICVEPKSCSALWPKSELDDKLLKLRVQNTFEISAPFLYTESHTSLLKLKNLFGGINVDIQISEGSVYISLAPYEGGTAPALLINHTQDTMNFWEKESVQVRKLPSKHCMFYTWENPSGPRILMWEGANKKELSNDLRKDDLGEYSIRENYSVFWVSFLDGMQRILLFTQAQDVVTNAQAANLFEVIQQEITISIHGLGLSLVNNVNRSEIMYLGIASSGIIWEHAKINSRRFKHFTAKESLVLEAAYKRYLEESEEDRNPRVQIDAKTEVDFSHNLMLKPHKRLIRRTFETGLWIQTRSSPSQQQLHAKVNRLQIDNQMYDCIFPVVLAPVPLPKSVAIDSGMKPFAELSIVQLLMKNSQVKQYKYFKLLIQEFHVKVDLGFVNALCGMFETANYSEAEEQEQFLTDMKLVDEPLFSHVSTQSLQEQKSFYDLLHFSPLKIHVSFSMAAGTSAGQSSSTPNFLNVLLQSLGMTLTDLQDVVFKLAYFEREYTFLTQKQLTNEATRHYVGQGVKQLYVLVLGLDVLGNPYGLVRGITQGVEDLFYEPFQGAIQGPGEFAEGLALGVRSLFGHTVGGAAGAVSRITGAMGKGIAALTFDKDYQRKRRDQINKKPATVQEGIARSGKGLVMGVVDGVTGVFTKPISGAKEEGVGGFFKGLGKGAMGLVTRPTAGVIDFASGSLDAVKRVTEVGEDANRLRPTRLIQGDGLVRPYNRHDAQGNKLLNELEKGKFASTDIYDSHYSIVDKREVLLLTDKRLAFISHNEIFGGWQVEWAYTWPELQHPPTVVPKGVAIQTEKRKKLSLLGSSDSGKIILISDPLKREEICTKIETLRGNA